MFQQIILIGNLGGEPTMQYTPAGVAFTKFNLAVNRKWTGQDGQQQEKTTWFNITLWRRQAEIASEYLHKGHRCMIVGEVEHARPWTDRDGNMRASIEVTAHELKLMQGKSDGQAMAEATSSAADSSTRDEDIPF